MGVSPVAVGPTGFVSGGAQFAPFCIGGFSALHDRSAVEGSSLERGISPIGLDLRPECSTGDDTLVPLDDDDSISESGVGNLSSAWGNSEIPSSDRKTAELKTRGVGSVLDGRDLSISAKASRESYHTRPY